MNNRQGDCRQGGRFCCLVEANKLDERTVPTSGTVPTSVKKIFKEMEE